MSNGTDAIKALRAEITERKRDLARYEKALALLEDVPSNTTAPPTAIAPSVTRKRSKPSRVAADRLAIIEKAIRAFAEDHDEFRQVDIRMNSGIDKSSTMAIAFEQLRQAGTIRFARRDGIQKFYRLTEAARRETNGE